MANTITVDGITQAPITTNTSTLLGSITAAAATGFNAETGTVDSQNTQDQLTAMKGVPQPAPTTSAELDAQLSQTQNAAYQSLNKSGDKLFATDTNGELTLEQAKQNLADMEAMPEAPSLVQTFQDMRKSMGLDGLENDLNNLKNEERQQQAIRRERIGNTFEERTRMSAIQGQVSEIERQEMQRLDFIGREIQYHTDLINSAYNIINLTTQLMNTDFQNAKSLWETKFNANMDMYKVLRGEFEADRTFDQQVLEFEKSTATANLQVYMDLITAGQMDYNSLDEATKTQITKLEIQSGLGAGFLSKVKLDPQQAIVSVTQRTYNGVQYSDIVRRDASGKLTVETVKLGSVTVSSGGGGSSSATTAAAKAKALSDATAKYDKAFHGVRPGSNGYMSYEEPVMGADGKVGPDTYQQLRAAWVAEGFSGDDFDARFAQLYVNPSHWQDYGGQLKKYFA